MESIYAAGGLTAKVTPGTGTPLPAGYRRSVGRVAALREDPRAPTARLSRRCAWNGERAVTRPRRRARVVVALSGLDGVGKSTQTQALREELSHLGYQTTVVWNPIGNTASLRRIARAVKGRLARLPFGPLAGAGPETVARTMLSQPGAGVSAKPWPLRLAAVIWSAVMTVDNGLSYRRSARGADIVIYDRYVLDTVVNLRFLYSPDHRLPVHEALIRWIAPRPQCAFLLDADPEIAHARKPDWTLGETRGRAHLYRQEYVRFGARRLDAERPVEELTSEIIGDVLAAAATLPR